MAEIRKKGVSLTIYVFWWAPRGFEETWQEEGRLWVATLPTPALTVVWANRKSGD